MTNYDILVRQIDEMVEQWDLTHKEAEADEMTQEEFIEIVKIQKVLFNAQITIHVIAEDARIAGWGG